MTPILRGETPVVYGSRFLRGTPSGAPWATVAANRFLTGLTNVLYGSHLTDMETCYKVMRTHVAQGWSSKRIASISNPRLRQASARRSCHRRTAGFATRLEAVPKEEDRLARRDDGNSGARPTASRSMKRRGAAWLAAAVALMVMAFGLVKGTWAAGGSDSSCYALMADAFAAGDVQPFTGLANEAPWPDAARTLPGRLHPLIRHAGAASPICAPGFLGAARAIPAGCWS